MRVSLVIIGLLFGLMVAGQNGQVILGTGTAEAFNPLKYCMNKCVTGGSVAIEKCEKNQCAKIKSKSKRKKCERSCNKPEGLLQYCDTSCKKSQMCTRGLEMKTCLKEKCDPYKKSDIRRYIKCKNQECSSICK